MLFYESTSKNHFVNHQIIKPPTTVLMIPIITFMKIFLLGAITGVLSFNFAKWVTDSDD